MGTLTEAYAPMYLCPYPRCTSYPIKYIKKHLKYITYDQGIGASVHRSQLGGGVQNEAPMLKDRVKRHRSSRGPIVAIGEPLYAVVVYTCRYREGECSSRGRRYTLSLSTRDDVAVSFVVVDGVAQICFRTNISTRSYLFHVKSPHLHHVKYRA